ncbi:MAG: molybdenum cofactor guanylyltransferase [Acidobacteria bacterium]|nr:molybdenum cofactor guanylyltransferase [Acidobacteriota bacterium]
MGSNKALLEVNGQPMISILVDRVRSLTNQIIISSNDDSSYRFLNVPVVPDRFAERGPLAGFHAAMLANTCSLYIVLACDLPNLRASFLNKLIALADGFDAVIPVSNDGIAHPLCAVYRQTCLPLIEKALQQGSNKAIEPFLNDTLRVKWVRPEEGLFADSDLANINTPEDLQRLHSLPGKDDA